METAQIKLSTLCEGAAEERFSEKLASVLANIEDPNTLAKTPRQIVVTVTFSPGPDRDVAAVGLAVEAKLAPTVPVASTVFIGRRDGALLAIENNPKQLQLFNDAAPRPVAVTEA